ncbi:MAG TPA: beta-N-acetylhexosaminidase [Gammaproteobacteria bacterium]|nr:beta-N-acetylhexosaminidase [Gammaproteobacteria bacterium]
MRIGSVMIDLEGTHLTPKEQEYLTNPQVGGVIFFTRNYENRVQLQRLIESIRALRDPILIAVDQEGGQVQRFRKDFTLLPALAELGDVYQQNPQQALSQAEYFGHLMALELLELGLDMSLAPVLDLNRNISAMIGRRSFHNTVAGVVALAKAYIQGMHTAGMVATGKHFPGHGGVVADSHLTMPVDTRDFSALYQEDMQPFIQLKDLLWGIMPAHVHYSAIDENPAGFSPFWLQKILRNQLGFDGVIISDDLTMGGAKEAGGSYLNRARKALAAGCDMVIVCNNPAGTHEILTGLSHELSPDSERRLLKGRSKKII